MSVPLLSIVIVAYKSRDEINACLMSLPRTLEGRDVSVFVADNSPGDGTVEIVGKHFPWVNYLAPAKNLGFGCANNLGYAQINPECEFVLILNPDTICNEAALAHCIRRLRADHTIGLISPKLVLTDGSMDLACRRSIPTLWDGLCRAIGLAAAFPKVKVLASYNLTHLPDAGTYDVGAINGAFMMGRRDVFDAVARKAAPPVLPGEVMKLKFTEGEKVESSELRVDGSELKDLSVQSSDQEPKACSLPPSASSSELKTYSLPPTASSNTRAAHVFDESFFMYGDDLDLCIRVVRAGCRIVYDGAVSITHLKGMSVAKDYSTMSSAIFDANRDVYLKHFNPHRSRLVAWKYHLAFGLWKRVARLRAALKGHRRVRPL